MAIDAINGNSGVYTGYYNSAVSARLIASLMQKKRMMQRQYMRRVTARWRHQIRRSFISRIRR